MPTKEIKISALLLALLLLSPLVLAVSLRDIDVSLEEIDLEDTFSVEVDFSGDTCGTEVRFFVDDELFSSKIVGCDRDSIESDDWDLYYHPLESLPGFQCPVPVFLRKRRNLPMLLLDLCSWDQSQPLFDIPPPP